MYLSQLLLNPHSRQVQRELADPYQRHRTIMKAFPSTLPEEERVLHRVNVHPKTDVPILLVQSQTRPDWGELANNYLLPPDPYHPLPNPTVKDFTLSLQAGQILHFRLRANPTVKKKREGKHGNRVPLVREERQREWLARKAGQHGFRLLHVGISSQGDRYSTIRRNDHKHRLKLYVVQFDGRLQVTDPEKLKASIAQGIGPSKAFGCGLLSLAPG